MPSKSEKQRRFFGMVRAYQKGELDDKYVNKKIQEAATIKPKVVKEFAESVESDDKKDKDGKKNANVLPPNLGSLALNTYFTQKTIEKIQDDIEKYKESKKKEELGDSKVTELFFQE